MHKITYALQLLHQAQDTLAQIASANGTTVAALVSLNGISDADLIYAGQTLRLTGTGAATTSSYTVRSGDTLGTIASRHGTSVAALVRLNGLDALKEQMDRDRTMALQRLATLA